MTFEDSDINKEFETLCRLYFDARESYTIAENEIEAFPIGPANEFRSILYHCMNALSFDDKQSIIKEIDEAQDHTKRAIYDSYEIAVVHLSKYIQDFLKEYSKSKVIKYIPEYFNEMLPYIEEIKIKLVTERVHRNKWEDYKDTVIKLQEYKKILLRSEPKLSRNKFISNNIIQVVVGSIVGALITFFLLKI